MTARLLVRPAVKEEVYRGLVRINEADRKTWLGGTVKESKVCLLRIRRRFIFAWIRGYAERPGVILLDDYQRTKLRVALNEAYDVHLTRLPVIGPLAWAFTHPEPIYRASAWLGVLSVVLGVIALFTTGKQT